MLHSRDDRTGHATDACGGGITAEMQKGRNRADVGICNVLLYMGGEAGGFEGSTDDTGSITSPGEGF